MNETPSQPGERVPRAPGRRRLGLVFALTVAGAGGVWVAGSRAPAPPSLAAAERLPARGRLLWLAGRPAVPGPGGVAVADTAGRVLIVDERLRVRATAPPGDVASVTSAAPAAGGGVWVVDGNGRLLEIGADGDALRQLPSPYTVAALGGVTDDGSLMLVRAPAPVTFALDTAPAAPVLVLDGSGRVAHRYGRAVRPAQPLLADLANAGYVARAAGRTFFAPALRDEVVAFGPAGDTLWIVRRGLAHATPEPRFVVRDGRPALDAVAVNLGLAAAADGRVYVLSSVDAAARRARLDVLDAASGVLLTTFDLPTTTPTLVATRDGAVHLVPAAALLARAAAAERPLLPAFNWLDLTGGRVSEDALRGRVTLVNVWASWCAPCREEMPELVALWESLRDSGVALLAVNEDVDPDDARAWLAATALAPPVALAGGRARATLHYPGLPYTLLADRDGRIAQRWIGYAGPRQIDAIRSALGAELRRRGR